MAEKSFAVVDEDLVKEFEDEQVMRKYGRILSARKSSLEKRTVSLKSKDDDFDLDLQQRPLKMSSAGPPSLSGRKTVQSASESDSDDYNPKNSPTSATAENVTLNEYDPKRYEDLVVSENIKEIFQYITKYIPQQIGLDQKFKPFVPDFIPAVGDIDAFLKVIPPDFLVSPDGNLDISHQILGLEVLDEPSADQSDAALLHLQLRVESVNSNHHIDDNAVVKRVDNVEKNSKTIDKWIKDISALHRSKTSPSVRYSQSMPDLDELMQEWPEDVEKQLKENGFPKPKGNLEEYVEEICKFYQIPAKNRIEALHLLFSLYAAVKGSDLFKNSQTDAITLGRKESRTIVTDQLVLDE